MSKYKLVTSLVVLIIFASVSLSIAEVESETSNDVSPSSQPELLKVVGIVAKITGDTLYLENNKKYDLRNAKVTYNQGKRISEKKKIAEMFFVDGVLKEVIIK